MNIRFGIWLLAGCLTCDVLSHALAVESASDVALKLYSNDLTIYGGDFSCEEYFEIAKIINVLTWDLAHDKKMIKKLPLRQRMLWDSFARHMRERQRIFYIQSSGRARSPDDIYFAKLIGSGWMHPEEQAQGKQLILDGLRDFESGKCSLRFLNNILENTLGVPLAPEDLQKVEKHFISTPYKGVRDYLLAFILLNKSPKLYDFSAETIAVMETDYVQNLARWNRIRMRKGLPELSSRTPTGQGDTVGTYRLTPQDVEKYQKAGLRGDADAAEHLRLYYTFSVDDEYRECVWGYISALLGNEATQIRMETNVGRGLLDLKRVLVFPYYSRSELEQHPDDIFALYGLYLRYRYSGDQEQAEKYKNLLQAHSVPDVLFSELKLPETENPVD